jgi:Fic family protein
MVTKMDKPEFLNLYSTYSSLTNEILNFDKFNHYAIVHHSNYIEGSTLSLDETYLLLDENLTPKNKPINDTYMALDHYAALMFITNKAIKHQNITVSDIKELSSLILKNTGKVINCLGGTFDSSKGDFRLLTVRAGNTTFMDYKKVPIYIDNLINDINHNLKNLKTVIDIYQFSFDVHYQLLTIHPFADGNGRLARLMMNYVQKYHNLPLTYLFTEDKSDYYHAIQKTRDDENIEYFRDFMFTQTIKLFKKEIYINKNNDIKTSKNNRGIKFIF